MKKESFIKNINEIYLKIINNRKIIIDNYNTVREVGKNMIVVTNYMIEGEDLIVEKIDGYSIEIKGKIQKITFI